VRFRWTRHAVRQVDEIGAFIAQDDPQAADRVVGAVEAAVATIEKHPAIGRLGRTEGTRELVVVGTPYIVAYALREDRGVILSVRHSSREWPDYFESGEDDA
jgi:toxin ParE1/3/4